MNTVDRVLLYNEYGVKLQLANGLYIVGVKFSPSWMVIKPTNDAITCSASGDGDDYFYYSANAALGTDAIFDALDETIEFNKDVERKADLFQEKYKELQRIFFDEPYERLKTLTFKMKSKAGRKPKGKEEEAQQPDSAVVEANDSTNDPKDKEQQSSIDEKVKKAIKNSKI